MPIGTGIIYNVGDLILSQVSGSGTSFLETKIAAATSSIVYFDSTARINSASLNSITVGTASYVSGSRSIITNLTASNISASGTGSFGMVGIGTSSPAYKLDVTGEIRQTGNNFWFSSARIAGDGSGNIDINYNNGSSPSFTWYNGGTSTLARITSTGNMGIGTSSPATKLDVKGHVFVANAANGNNTIAFGDIGGLGPLNGAPDNLTGSAFLVVSSSTVSGAPSHMKFYTTTGGVCGERMRIDESGNVGIGATVPAYKLDVSGTARVGDSFFVTTGTTADAKVEIGSGRTGNGNAYVDLIGDATYTDYGLRLIRSNGGANTTSAIAHRGTGTLYITAVEAASISLETTNTTRMTITSGGNVGIGTTVPGALLDVSYGDYQSAGTVRIGADLGANTSRTNVSRKWGLITGYNYTNASAAIPIIGYDSANTYTAINIGGGTSSIPASPTYISFFTTSSLSTYGAERVRIISDGNVGIGTTVPANKLHVIVAGGLYNASITNQSQLTGSVIIQADNSGANSRASLIMRGSDTIGGAISVAREDTSPTWRTYMAFYTNNVTSVNVTDIQEKMRLNADGNLGIGTTVPAYLLDVSGSSRHGYRAADTHQFTGSVSLTGGLFATNITASNISASRYTGSSAYFSNIGFTDQTVASDTSTFPTGSTSDGLILDGGVYTNGVYRTRFVKVDRGANLSLYIQETKGSSGSFSNLARFGTHTNSPNTFEVFGSTNIQGSITSSNFVGPHIGNTIGTASWASNALTASFLPVGTYNITSSWAQNVVSASYALTSSFATTAQTANALNVANTYTIAGLTSAYVDVNGSGTIPTTGIYRPSTKTLGLSADGTLIFKISNVSAPATSSIETGNFVVQSGNFGLGTNSPNNKLDIFGGTGTTLNMSNVDDGNRGGKLTFISSSATGRQFYVGTNSSIYNLVFGIDSIEKARIDTNGNLGIGTTAPAATLHVSGSSGATATFQGSTQSTMNLKVGSFDNYLVGTSTGDISIRPSGSTAVTILSNGSVGIGTTIPSYKLDVQKTSDGTIGYFRRIGATINPALGIYANESGNSVGLNTDYVGAVSPAIAFSIATSEKVRIANDGNVGIGTSVVGQNKLMVYNSISATDYTASTFSGGTGYFDNKGGISIYNPNSTANNFSAIDFYIDQTNYSNVGAARIVCKTGTRSTGGTFDTSLIFLTHNQGGSWNQMLLDNSGNLGIGTTNPVAKLQVAGNISGSSFTSSISNAVGFLGTSSWAQNVVSASFATTAQTANALNTGNSYTIAGLTNNSTLSQQGTLSMGSGYQILATTGTAPIPGISFVGDTNTGIYAPSADTLGFSISGSEKVRIDSGGNVGIGTTSPGALLEVSSSTAASLLNIKGAGGNGILFVSGSGNVGIGTTTLTGILTVYKAGAADRTIHFENGTTAVGVDANIAKTLKLNLVSGGKNGSFDNGWRLNAGCGIGQATNNGYLAIEKLTAQDGSSSTEVARFDTAGNLGIGTTSPSTKLDVYTNGANNYISNRSDGADGSIQGITFVGGVYNRAIISSVNESTNGGYLTFQTYTSGNGSEKMRITSGGNVGIGTTAPAAKLEITGSSNSVLLNIKSAISGAILYVSGSGAVGIGTSNVGAYTLQVSGSFAATTKSFVIEHPTKAGKKLIYGSLESPYHGIRLTGRDTLVNGKCKIQLPDYIYKLILHDSVNIQLTGIKCNKTLYVDEINIPENYFTIAYDKAIFESYKDYDFFWDFTGIRADVPELTTEL